MKKLLLIALLIMAGTTSIFAQFVPIGIRGSATSVGWDGPNDILMETTDGVTYNLNNVTLFAGGLKFRENVDAFNDWGGTGWPSGIGVLNQGGADIPCQAGVYNITFNRNTLAYNFTYLYAAMGLRGNATTTGWDGMYDVRMNTSDGIVYTLSGLTLTEGGLKFRENNEWPNNWGGTGWPSGVGIFDQDGVDIPCQPGIYNVTFNRNTLEYNFVQVFTTIGIRGSATTVGWDGPNDIQMTTTDGVLYTLSTVTLTDGGLKFRENNEWPNNWGGTGWPSGVGIFDQGGVDIPCVAGTYNVSFNRATLEYNFEAVVAAITNFGLSSVTAYPNPTQDTWTISNGEFVIDNIQITDITGKIVYSKNIQAASAVVNGTGLASGIYLAKLSANNAVKIIKLVKK